MDLVPVVLAFLVSLAIVLITMPPLIRKMRDGGMVGRDVNKRHHPEVAELGGIAAVFAFSISLTLVVGVEKLVGNLWEPPYLAVISVFFIAAMIGLIDDISNVRQRVKAVAVVFASLPLLLVHFRSWTDGSVLSNLQNYIAMNIDIRQNAFIALPFDGVFDLRAAPFVYWLVLVPIGVTGVANAMNMSAGYNGLESGQIATVTGVMFLVAAIKGSPEALLIFASLFGVALGLFWFNRHPARVFIGDIGTLGLGAAIAAGAIIGGLELYGLVAIAPAFYEAGATFYYAVVKKNGNRRQSCHSPQIANDGKLSPPPGAERYTLAYFLLGKRPMTEPRLVATLLSLYLVSGLVAIALSLV